MNTSKGDPLRFLKKLRSRTPSKVFRQSSKTEFFPEGTPMVESKLEQTLLLKQNCYDPNKYYSEQCQKYLRLINYVKASSPTAENKKNERQGSKSKQQPRSNAISQQQNSIAPREVKNFVAFLPQNKELTFKKIESQESSNDLAQKQIPRQLQLEYELHQFDQNVETEEIGPLQECVICGRKFNPTSYQKHTRICEKVFSKKRKPFSSEKQRSSSREKKQQ